MKILKAKPSKARKIYFLRKNTISKINSKEIIKKMRERDKLGKDRSKKKQGRKKKKIDIDFVLELHKQRLSTYKIAEEYNKRHKPFISHQTVHNILKKKS